MSGLITYAIVLDLFFLFMVFLHKEIKAQNKNLLDEFETEINESVEEFRKE